MDITQLILVISIVIITTLLTIIAFYFISILKEVKMTLSKSNLILDDTHLITSSIAQPVSSFADFFKGLKDGIQSLNNLFKK
ncbi:hypothetical protein DRH14_00910 [Candidatus Shapirobacteria bacterium]|nr:MAG: hypothetical protein DRH14_00910 [Candidatus Shapirobacteria bacterium]